jgi:hypothetical protein
LAGELVVHASASADLTVTTYPQALLEEARSLLDRGKFGIAVVVAHIACEVAVERSFTDAFAARNLQDLEESVTKFFSGYSLANDRLRPLYTALTGDEVHKQAFWSGFVESARQRNKIVHQGRAATRLEAEKSVSATEALVAHLGK